ncbi:uncharacterized protein LOC114275043 isoform X2 [Camellia sinensis]|uniref:uncharacterized protein LOC114275043 isoform X2 n=1 Tax=Camellia sinensis TaxID=4442 RepID=UPI0010367CD5|nr:uncharacterized protein LOC114275043 isoform X2 [Camellia sinensis]
MLFSCTSLGRDPPSYYTNSSSLYIFFSCYDFFPTCLECIDLSVKIEDSIMGDSASYIHMVQHLIEKCLIFNMTKEECMEALSKHAKIEPVITSTDESKDRDSAVLTLS